VSWGTKGSDKAEVLPSVSSKKPKDGEAQATVEDTARTREDLDQVFKDTVTRALTKVNVVEEIEKPNMDDQNKTFRTRLVAVWMLSNAALAVVIENINGLVLNNAKDIEDAEKDLQQRQAYFFKVLLWSTFGLAFVRFVGVRPCHFSHVLALTAGHSVYTSGSSATSSVSAAATERVRCLVLHLQFFSVPWSVSAAGVLTDRHYASLPMRRGRTHGTHDGIQYVIIHFQCI
jgi:hypothetical protein